MKLVFFDDYKLGVLKKEEGRVVEKDTADFIADRSPQPPAWVRR